MEADFSGYATKAGLECSDGRTIMPDAFKHQDGTQVPLVWQHKFNEPSNILGYATLHAKDGNLYTKAYFNKTPNGQNVKAIVQHGDIKALSIRANKLDERGRKVYGGNVQEVSLVLSGANPGARIDNVNFLHSDGEIEELEEIIITTGEDIEHEEISDEEYLEQAEEATLADVYNSFTDVQKDVVHYMITRALEGEGTVEQSEETTEEGNLAHQEGTVEMANVFEKESELKHDGRPTLTRAQLRTILVDAKSHGSLKASFLAHAEEFGITHDGEYGITNIDTMFPDAKNVQNRPEWITRRMDWVPGVLNGAVHSPFSRIKSRSADLTHDEARAKGYIKGDLKKEQFFAIASRTTTPKTVYKKQKLDRDDIIDLTEFDVVDWIKQEMRFMLEEEIARAILISDGREVDDEDKIDETHLRPIAHDDDFYAHHVTVAASTSTKDLMKEFLRARKHYKGAGNPTFYTTEDLLTDMLLLEDNDGRRVYNTEEQVAAAIRARNIVTVPVMDDTSTDGGDLLGIFVNMSDYTIGSDRGGDVNWFDDFDIDYNQFKYLIETRLSGALTKHKTALVFQRAAGTQVTPDVPTFNTTTGVLTIPTDTGVVYKNAATDATLTAGAQTAIASGASITVYAVPASTYYFPHNINTDWTYTRL